MDGCVFCKIIKGEMPSTKIYETNEVLAFLTIEAVNPGHTLVIPKQHQPDLFDLDEATYSSVMKAAKLVASAQKKLYSPAKIGLMVSGWDVPHAHVHVLPMYESTDITSKKSLDHAMLKPDRDELEAEAAKLREAL